MAETPTYREVVRHGVPTYVCLYCSSMEMEHTATDLSLFTLHMAQRHDGRLLKEGEVPQTEEPTPETSESPPSTPAAQFMGSPGTTEEPHDG